jgi:carboxymethylenebutenolidase
MDGKVRKQAIDLYDRFTHDGLDRRMFMSRMVAIAGSVAAAEALIASIAASPAAAAVIPENDPRIDTGPVALAGGYNGYLAQPTGRSLNSDILVIHENRGLNDHIKDVARRLAVAGFRATAPDMLSPAGGTPADADAAREAIGKLDLAKSVGDAVAMLVEAKKAIGGGKVGAVGFCWGGGFVNRLAVAAGDKLDAGVAYYGPAPDPSEAVKVEAALLIHDAGLDERVNRTSFPWVEALRAADKTVRFYLYDGVNHAFNNDTSAERYDKAAAALAWSRTLAFFNRHLR